MGRYRMIQPGQPGWQPNKRYQWTGFRKAVGLPEMPTKNGMYPIHGYFLMDHRFTPCLVIFKNCVFKNIPGTRPMLSEPPVPFESVREAWIAREKMHLSMDSNEFVEITALVPDPGVGAPKPDTIFIHPSELKQW